MSSRNLTELEGCVLGLVWAHGPCTAYSLRKHLQDSPTPHWSASAGSIYPLVERLQQWKLIKASAHAAGRRPSQKYVLTPAGLRRLCAWIKPPLSAQTVGAPPDPLRTRLRFLQALPESDQREFFSDADRGLQEQIRRTELDLERFQKEGPDAVFMARGALASLQARRAWILEVDRKRNGPPANVASGQPEC